MIYLNLALLFITFLSFYFAWRVESGGFLVFTPFLLFGMFELISLWPATVYAYYAGISNDEYPMFVAVTAFVFFILGFITFRWMKFGKSQRPGPFLQSPIVLNLSQKSYIWGSVVTAAFLLALGLYFYRGLPPFTKYLLGMVPDATADYVHESRKVFTKSHYFGGTYRGQGIIRSFMEVGWPFLFVISMMLFIKTRKMFWLLFMLLFFLVSVMYISGDGTRAPLIFFIIFSIITVSMVMRIKIKKMVLLFIGICVLMIALSLASGKTIIDTQDSILETVIKVSFTDRNSPFKRIVTTNSNGMNTVQVIELVREGILDYQFGEIHAQKAILALPGKAGGVPFSRKLSELLQKKSATSFTSTTYLATLFVDFGLLGVLFGYLMLGCLFGLVHQMLFNSSKTPLNIALISFATLYLGKMALNGFIGFFSSYMVVVAVWFIFCLGACISQIKWPIFSDAVTENSENKVK
jgi:hypothetical protein